MIHVDDSRLVRAHTVEIWQDLSGGRVERSGAELARASTKKHLATWKILEKGKVRGLFAPY